MRILVITDGFPYPLTSGRLREHFRSGRSGRGHQLRLLERLGVQNGIPVESVVHLPMRFKVNISLGFARVK